MAVCFCFVFASCSNTEQKKAEALNAVKDATAFNYNSETIDLDGMTVDRYLTTLFKLTSEAAGGMEISTDWKIEEAEDAYEVSVVATADDGEDEYSASFVFIYKNGEISFDKMTDEGEKVSSEELMSTFFLPGTISALKSKAGL